MIRKMKRAGISAVLVAVLMICGGISFVHATDAGAYTATMTAHYANPVTGVVEDSGGEDSMAIGQGMVEGATSPAALIEVDNNGQMYATVRFTLMTATSTPSFRVNGTPVSAQCMKQSGDIGDFRFAIPNESALIRAAMHVDPMDRDVIFFMTLSGMTPGSGDFIVSVDTSKENKSEDEKDEKTTEEKEEKDEKDELSEIKAKAKAKAAIVDMENISKDQKSEFCKKIDEAESEDSIKSLKDEAKKADQKIAKEAKLGKIKTEAQQKIDKMEKLSDSAKKDFKSKVRKAENASEIEKILKEAERENKGGKGMYIGIAVVLAVVIGAVITFVLRKKKKA